jgi:glycosyltransferase involved in cell wall biosynthesis
MPDAIRPPGRTAAVLTAARLTAADLVAGPAGTLAAAAPLPAGWYRLRLVARTPDRPAVRKRAELFADADRVEAFEWNRDLRENLLVRLPRPASAIRLELRHAGDGFRPDRFELRRVSAAAAAARAVRLKLKLLADYQCVWPVLARGGRLLARGDVREFGRRLLKGIPDARAMRLEVKRADEVAASWWRRGGLPAAGRAELRAEAAAAPPVPVAVLVPADPTRADHARQAVLSVLRQPYPHWEALVAWPTAAPPAGLRAVAGWDSRITLVPSADGLAAAVRSALSRTGCDRLLVLPPDCELTEPALLRLSKTPGRVVTCRPPDAAGDARPAVVPVEAARSSIPDVATVAGVVLWAAGLAAAADAHIDEPLVVPFAGGRVRLATPAPAGRPLVLAADVRGLSGWDHVTFAVLKGLHSAGVPVRRHPAAKVYAELLPPGVAPEPVPRSAGDPQLVIAPPFLAGRFAPDAATAVYTMWETDRIDPPLAAVLSRARVVIVPSEWGAESFRASGVTAPIEVVPLGYDPLVHYPSPPIAMGGLCEPCTFGTAGALSLGGLRKNVRRVADLFARAFPAEPDVRLRVKITPNCPPFEVPADPRVDVVRATLPAADLADWNRSLTAYVNASFAEGFGLHLLEAMACGRPLVSPAYSGLTAFFDAAVGYVVPHRLVEARNDVYRGRWADPDDDALIAAMRRVYADRDEAARLGEAAAARARRFTWRDTGRQLLAVLERYGLV